MKDIAKSVSSLLLAHQDNLRYLISSFNTDRDFINDTLQEVNLIVLEKAGLIPVNDGEFVKYVLCIAKNVILNNKKKESLRHPVGVICEPSYTREHIGMDLRFLLDALPYKTGKTIQMFLQGYRYEEIAIFNNIPIGTVKSRIFNARRKMQIWAV